jgi:hypothetical protein
MLPDISHDRPDDSDLDVPVAGGQVARQEAILATAGYAWSVYGHKPVSEREIEREIERQAGQRH